MKRKQKKANLVYTMTKGAKLSDPTEYLENPELFPKKKTKTQQSADMESRRESFSQQKHRSGTSPHCDKKENEKRNLRRSQEQKKLKPFKAILWDYIHSRW